MLLLAQALSALFDLPSGAVIVWALAVCGLGLALATRGRPAALPDPVLRGAGAA